MIERYSLEEISKVWSEDNIYQIWLDIEFAILAAYQEKGIISKNDFDSLKNSLKIDIDRIKEIEKETHHDILGFLKSLQEQIKGDESRFIHLGLTSSDVKDTALNLQLKQSIEIILKDLEILLTTLKNIAIEHKYTTCIGRSHGIHAEITSFGLKVLNYYYDLKRSKKQFLNLLEEISVGMFSGAVGTYANIDPELEEIACAKLNLKACKISTQVISRDRIANIMNYFAVYGSLIEKIAIEIRHLQRTEVLELEEPFYEGQKGSSAMPHKRNPWRSENISGLARMLRGYAASCLENIGLWHERDISHSSVERVVVPDACILTHYMTKKINEILAGLKIYPENMQGNLNKFGGICFSQQVLLLLIEKGMKRENAYDLVQKIALQVWNKQDGNFKKIIFSTKSITDLISDQELQEAFCANKQLKNIEKIYQRVM